jgi:hypothetical protein
MMWLLNLQRLGALLLLYFCCNAGYYCFPAALLLLYCCFTTLLQGLEFMLLTLQRLASQRLLF